MCGELAMPTEGPTCEHGPNGDVRLVVRGYSEATCTTPISAADCTDCRWASETADTGETSWYKVDPLRLGSTYFKVGADCVAGTGTYHRLLGRGEDGFVALTLTTH
jgi:hypothetical protein